MSETSSTRFAGTIAALEKPADVRALRLPVLHLVMSLRLCALFDRVAREPVGELSTRFGSVAAALAVLELARAVGRAWPEPYAAGRPCCLRMTPDETTLAALGRAALAGDRSAFSDSIAGFVRADRHDALFGAVVRAVSAVPQP